MREMDQNPEQPRRIYRKIESPREILRRKRTSGRSQKEKPSLRPEKPKEEKLEVPAKERIVEEGKPEVKQEQPPKRRRVETAGQFVQRVEKESAEILSVAGAQQLDPMLVARRLEERLCDLESQNKKIPGLKFEPPELLHAIDYEDLEDHARNDPEREELRRIANEFRARINFNNEYLDFAVARREGAAKARGVVEESTAMDSNKNWGIFFRKPGVAEAFRELERRGETFVTVPTDQLNQARADIVTHLQNTIPDIESPQARSAQIIAERLWRVTERDDIYDPEFKSPENFRSKRIQHLEEFSGRPPYNENIPNRHLLLEVDSKGERIGDLGMRDFFTHYSRIFETMPGIASLPANFYAGRDHGRRHLSLADAELENFDWENRVFEKALGSFWVDMADADDTRKALVGEGDRAGEGLLQGPVDLEKVNAKFREAWANVRSERPYKFMRLAEIASREKLSGWHYDNDRTVEMANTVEEHTEGLRRAGRESGPGKNLHLERLWYRYFEETGLSRRITSGFNQLPEFDTSEKTGIIVSRDVFENLKTGGFEVTPEGVVRLLLNIHDREVLIGAFKGADERFYQTLKYFAGVVELNDGRLVPIELLESGDLANIIPQDLARLNSAIIQSPMNHTINENIIAALTRVFNDEQTNDRRNQRERLMVTNLFWQNAWQGHMNERNRILRLLAEGEFTVGSLRDIYENVYLRPLRRKLGFYDVPLLRRLYFWEEGKFAFDRQTGRTYDLFDGYCELFRRLKNLRFHMGTNAGQFIVAPEAPPSPTGVTQEQYRYLAEREGRRPHGAGPDYVLNRGNTDFENQQEEPIFAFWLGDGMDNLDRFRKGWAGPILMFQNRFAMIERFFLKRSRKFLRGADFPDWQYQQFEPGDIDLALKSWSTSPVGISADQKADLARRLGATNLDKIFYQFKKVFWGITDESKGETEHPLGKGFITGFGAITGFLAGRAAPVVRVVQYLPIFPTSFPDVANGFLIGGALQAVGIPLPIGFFLGTAISKGYGTGYYQNGPSGWWRTAARNLWRLKNIRIPGVRHVLLPVAAMSAHDYIYDNETTVKITQEDSLTGEGIKPLLSFKF